MASTSDGVNTDFLEIAKLIGQLENHMQCAICHERLKKPRVLACLHTFCEECLKSSHRQSLENFVDSDSDSEVQEPDFLFIKCAYCREKTKLPENGISGLKVDFRGNKVGEILDALETRKRKMMESEYSCEVCSSSGKSVSAREYCQNCGQLFCELCSLVHRKINETKDHFVLSVSDLMTGKAKLRKTEHEDVIYKMCPQHSEWRVKSFCRVCKKPVCFICTTFGKCVLHKANVCALDEARTEMSGIVEMLSDQLKHRQRTVEETLSKTNQVIATTCRIKDVHMRKVIALEREATRIFHQKLQRARSDKAVIYDGKMSSVQGIMTDIKKMKTVSEKALLLADDVLKGGNVSGTDLATTYACLHGVLQSIPDQLNGMNRELCQIEKDVLNIPEPVFPKYFRAGGTSSQTHLIPGRNTINNGSQNEQAHRQSNSSHVATSASSSSIGSSIPHPVIGLTSSEFMTVPPLTRDLPDHRSSGHSTADPLNGLSAAPRQTTNTPLVVSSTSSSANSSGSALSSMASTHQTLVNDHPVVGASSAVPAASQQPCANPASFDLSH